MVEEMQNQPDFPLKMIRFEEMKDDKDEDRISSLPDCLLVEIVSRLPATKCAVKTSTLSKRWKQIWTSVSNLIFIHDGDPNANFVSFVDKTLTQRGQLKLKKLRIDSTYNDRFEPHVYNWIRYDLNCNVEEIQMEFWHEEHRHWYLLDECFFKNSYFTDLNLTVCQFNPVGVISWKKLSSLWLSNVRLDEDMIENILSGSPVRETLKLKDCCGFRRLDITSKSVKKLVFNEYMSFQFANVIEINAPNILSLVIQSYLFIRKLLLINVSSLIEADLDYKLCGDYEITLKEAEEEMLKQFIIKLLHVKEVKIGSFCSKVLSCLEAKGGFSVPSNMKVFYFFSNYFDSDDESNDSEVVLLDDDPTNDEQQ